MINHSKRTIYDIIVLELSRLGELLRMSELKGLIKCLDCGKNYKQKKERKKIKFVCSGYDNKSTDCERFILAESDLMDIINKHFDIHKYETENKTIRDFISLIGVKDKVVKIIYFDGTTSLYGDNKIEF